MFCAGDLLPLAGATCYGSSLKPFAATGKHLAATGSLMKDEASAQSWHRIPPQDLRNIIASKCHVLFCAALLMPTLFLCQKADAQVLRQEKPPRTNAPPPDAIDVRGATQEVEGTMRRLRGAAEIETTEIRLSADEIDYDEAKGYAEARGNVRFDNFEGGEHVEADRAEYNLRDETGRFFNVRGSSPASIEARPGVLTTTSPFSFQGRWAERLKDRYILHEGFITNCRLPKPWWLLRGSTFDVIPGDRAIARNSVFWLKRVPLFYTPMFYKSLERAPRKSGFLTPNFGNSSRRGTMLGAGYYWAINRSYDAMYRAQLFTGRGFAHNADVRGKPSQNTDFTFFLYGVNDKGFQLEDGSRQPPESGYLMNFGAKSTDLPWGFIGRGQFNYLSSFRFRRAFTESFFEAMFTEVHSIGSIAKYWSTFGLTVAARRSEIFQWPTAENFPNTDPDAKLSLRKLPSVEFRSRDRQINEKVLPVWVSFDSSASLLRRNERTLTTRQFVERLDVEPRIMTALRWKDFHLVPAFSVRETHYGSSLDANGRLSGTGILRSSREFSAELIMPSLARVFDSPVSWFGTKVKHVIEPRASFRYTGGIGGDFRKLIRFDETELLTDTREVEISITNRLFGKRKDGAVWEAFSWELSHRRYFDPTFGGTIIEGERNVLRSSASLSAFAFLDGQRRYSPIASTLRMVAGGLGLEWQTDYDPARQRFVNSTLNANGRIRKDYFVSIGHNQVRSVPVHVEDGSFKGLTPRANQLFTVVGYGQENRRGFSAGFLMNYDYIQSVMQFAQTQVTYNTDCCGWSFQYRRFGFGRSENQFRVAFAVANIGSFGTLRRQERMF